MTLLIQANISTKYWLEALLTAVYLANRLPHSSLNFQVPYVLLYKVKPDYSWLKPFGCASYPWLRPYNSYKLCPKSTTCVFLGYCENTKGYRCLDPTTNRVYISRHVRFLESVFPFASTKSSLMSDPTHATFEVPLTDFSVSSSAPTCSPISLLLMCFLLL